VSETFRIVPAGDSAVVVEFEARIDPVVNARAIALADAVQSANLAGVRDVVPTYRSVAIYFDPLRTDYDALLKRLQVDARQTPDSAATSANRFGFPSATAATLVQTSTMSRRSQAGPLTT
jgi:Allophanate hydrolase subunit 1